jgi:hypothetical protein
MPATDVPGEEPPTDRLPVAQTTLSVKVCVPAVTAFCVSNVSPKKNSVD